MLICWALLLLFLFSASDMLAFGSGTGAKKKKLPSKASVNKKISEKKYITWGDFGSTYDEPILNRTLASIVLGEVLFSVHCEQMINRNINVNFIKTNDEELQKLLNRKFYF